MTTDAGAQYLSRLSADQQRWRRALMQPCTHWQVPIPMHMDLYHLQEEAEPSDRTALESVVDYIKQEIEVSYHPSFWLSQRADSNACTLGRGQGWHAGAPA